MKIIKTKSFELAIKTAGNEDAKRLVLALPGRLDTKDYASFHSHLNFLAQKGFYAVAFDPPGTWESPGGTELFTTTNYILAVKELIQFFGNKPTLLLGHSRGGTVSILAGTKTDAVIGIVPIMATYGEPSAPDQSTITDGFEVSYRDLPPGSTKTTTQKKFILSLNYFIDGQKYEVVSTLQKCHKPKLLIYGAKDEYTEPERVKEVFDTLSEPKMIHELQTTHDYRYYPKAIEEVNQVLGVFIDKYI